MKVHYCRFECKEFHAEVSVQGQELQHLQFCTRCTRKEKNVKVGRNCKYTKNYIITYLYLIKKNLQKGGRFPEFLCFLEYWYGDELKKVGNCGTCRMAGKIKNALKTLI
jgi:hypothetical protein